MLFHTQTADRESATSKCLEATVI